MFGYSKIAYVDLLSGEVNIRDVEEKLAYDFIGGRGWAAYLVFKEIDRIVDGLHSSNVLVVATRPLTGTLFQSGGKTTLAAVKPSDWNLRRQQRR